MGAVRPGPVALTVYVASEAVIILAIDDARAHRIVANTRLAGAR